MNEYTNIARQLVDKHGMGPIEIDKFDCFIVDMGMVKDPGTDDPADPNYRAFVADRTLARKRIVSGAQHLAEPFDIQILRPGETYEIKPMGSGAVDAAKEAIQRVDLFSSNKINTISKMKERVTKLSLASPHDHDLRESKLMLDIIEMQAQSLGKNFKAQIAQFNVAMLAVEKHVDASIEKWAQLEHQPEE